MHSVADRQGVLVELNLSGSAEPSQSLQQFTDLFNATFPSTPPGGPPEPAPLGHQYVRCLLTLEEVERLAQANQQVESGPSIFRIWPDYRLTTQIDWSLATIKADAASRSYGTTGAGVTWAVIDSGIDAGHTHFQNPDHGDTLRDSTVLTLHRDFTWLLNGNTEPSGPAGAPPVDEAALADESGHGTHVAGIIAGGAQTGAEVRIAANHPTAGDLPNWVWRTLDRGHSLTGVAPQCRLVSLKVTDEHGRTASSAVIAALNYIQELNARARSMLVHGVNISLGCEWYPDEYAAGQSPLCRTVDALVGTGVVVVVSAGNAGAGGTVTGGSSDVYGQLSTITDPGNAARAITVGSTHRTSPHTYGVTYTSSKGPTLDGRLKPDLVAPGERITSAAVGALRAGLGAFDTEPETPLYMEDSGTSMAAPHVSGAIAAFLSVRPEFVGQPDLVKEVFLTNATTLGRHEFFQGHGLVDLMRVLANI